LSERLAGFFLHKRTALKEAVNDPSIPSFDPNENSSLRLAATGLTRKREENSLAHHEQRVERYNRVRELYAKQMRLADIARELGMARSTVYYYLHMGQPPDRMRVHNRKNRPKKVARFQEYLLQRWNDGCRNARLLYEEIVELGYTASYPNVRRFLAQFRTTRKFKQVEPSPRPIILGKKREALSALQAARLMTIEPTKRSEWHSRYLERLCQADPTIAKTFELAQAFAVMLRERQGEKLDNWLGQVQEEGIPEICAFARSLRHSIMTR
jgi:AcrR family transcriptional regulator